MFDFLKKIKKLIAGYKTYIVCFTTIAGLAVAFSEGAISVIELYQGTMAALALITIKAGIARTGTP